MADISADLRADLEANPEQSFNLIIRTQGRAAAHLDWLGSLGVDVKRKFRMVPGLALTCTGAQGLALLEQEWVLSIEVDQAVHTT